MSNAVEAYRLTKKYRDITAVNEVSFAIKAGKVYGLLGRNGAGKTTLMQLITAQIFATGGEVKVFGEAPFENSSVLSQVCFIKDNQKYPENFRISDVLDVSASFFPYWSREYAFTLIETFELPVKRKVKALSRGMLSALGITVGLASRSPLTIFDEPHLGLDAVARSRFYDQLLEDYTERPRTIILSTHLIDEVSKILEHIILIDNGSIILDERAESLRGRAFTIVGSASKVDNFLANKEMIFREAFGGLVSATILGKIEARERMQAEELGLELVPVSLQQFIVHLTNRIPERKAVQAR